MTHNTKQMTYTTNKIRHIFINFAAAGTDPPSVTTAEPRRACTFCCCARAIMPHLVFPDCLSQPQCSTRACTMSLRFIAMSSSAWLSSHPRLHISPSQFHTCTHIHTHAHTHIRTQPHPSVVQYTYTTKPFLRGLLSLCSLLYQCIGYRSDVCTTQLLSLAVADISFASYVCERPVHSRSRQYTIAHVLNYTHVFSHLVGALRTLCLCCTFDLMCLM
jgi:hypothetical protein